MKRPISDEDDEGGKKRQAVEAAEEALLADEHSSQVDVSDASSSTLHDEAQLLTSTPATVVTEASTTVSGRKKFPSEHKTISCTVAGCNKMFNRPARLVAHLRSHNNEKPYKCTYEGCDKAYSDNKYLRGHIVSAHTKEAKFVCETCGKGFATGQRLNRHGLVHEGADQYRCKDYPPCDQSFRKHQTLQRHILKDHLGEKPYRCGEDGCDEAYDTNNALKAHMTRAHGEIRFWCHECTSAAAQDGDEEQPGGKPVGFTTQFLLEQHIRSEHVNCIFCDGLKFSGQYELEMHMEIYHSGMTVKDRKTVECDYEGCDKKFTKKSNMRVHYKAAHEGVRFTCGQVDTSDSTGLGDFNWAEEGCGQDFRTKNALEQHITYVHLGKQRQYYERPVTPERQRARTPEPSPPRNGFSTFLDELSGVTEHERRDIVCKAPGCIARFVRWADLDAHTRQAHPEQSMGYADQAEVDWEAENENLYLLMNLDGAGEDSSAIDPELLAQN